MRVLVTGASGFIGIQVVKALLRDGHEVVALSRKSGKTELDQLCVQVVQGNLSDVATLAAAAASSDAVMHLAFEHDFSRLGEVCAQDTKAISAINAVLAGSGRLFVMTSGIGVVGDTGDELVDDDRAGFGPRALSETTLLEGKGIQGVVFRLPPYVYSKGFSMFYEARLTAAQKTGSAGYVGTGDSKCGVIHVDDAAQAYVSLLTHPKAKGMYNIVGENGVTSKAIAETIASKVGCPAVSVSLDEASGQFGAHIAKLTSMNLQANGTKAQRDLEWLPQHTSFRETI